MSISPTADPKDVSMVDVSNALDDIRREQKPQDEVKHEPPARRKSTMILTDENESDQIIVDKGEKTENNDNDQMHIDQAGVDAGRQQGPAEPVPDSNVTIPVEIRWTQGGEKVYITGSFTGWRKMIGLAKQPDNHFLITLGLPVGTHRFRFVIDNELRFSDYLPTATDLMGNFVNYIEVTNGHVQSHIEQEQQKQLEEEQQQQQQLGRKPSVSRPAGRSDSMWGLTNDDDDMGNGYSRYHDSESDASANANAQHFKFISDIPPIFTDPKVMEQYYVAIDKQSKSQNGQQQAWLHPPQLPPHLENVILNNFNSMDRDNNSGALPIPNHVVLNHLATTSIKHNTLAVASVIRYKRKYVTQVLYAPLQQ